jgi:hypothetical protein
MSLRSLVAIGFVGGAVSIAACTGDAEIGSGLQNPSDDGGDGSSQQQGDANNSQDSSGGQDSSNSQDSGNGQDSGQPQGDSGSQDSGWNDAGNSDSGSCGGLQEVCCKGNTCNQNLVCQNGHCYQGLNDGGPIDSGSVDASDGGCTLKPQQWQCLAINCNSATDFCEQEGQGKCVSTPQACQCPPYHNCQCLLSHINYACPDGGTPTCQQNGDMMWVQCQ